MAVVRATRDTPSIFSQSVRSSRLNGRAAAVGLSVGFAVLAVLAVWAVLAVLGL